MIGNSNLNQRQKQQNVHAALGSAVHESNVALFTKALPTFGSQQAAASSHQQMANTPPQQSMIAKLQRGTSATSYNQIDMFNFGTKVEGASRMQRTYNMISQPRIGQSSRAFTPAVQMSMTQLPPGANQHMRKNFPTALQHNAQSAKARSKVMMMQSVNPAKPLQKRASQSKTPVDQSPVTPKSLAISPSKGRRSATISMIMSSRRNMVLGYNPSDLYYGGYGDYYGGGYGMYGGGYGGYGGYGYGGYGGRMMYGGGMYGGYGGYGRGMYGRYGGYGMGYGGYGGYYGGGRYGGMGGYGYGGYGMGGGYGPWSGGYGGRYSGYGGYGMGGGYGYGMMGGYGYPRYGGYGMW